MPIGRIVPVIRYLTLLAAILVSPLASTPAAADEEQALVDKAALTVESFSSSTEMAPMRRMLKSARGVIVVPQLLKGGFFIGGEGGSGVLLARDRATDSWSAPAFYTMGAVSFGLQIGAEAKEVVLVIMTDKGMEAILNNEVKLGADVSAAAGPIGKNLEAATTTNMEADVYSFATAKGLFVGASVEGAIIKARHQWNANYYGRSVTPQDIVLNRSVSAPGANRLTTKLSELSR